MRLPAARMNAFTRRYYKWLRHIPRRKHFKGGWLHRVLGEKLFAHELWKPTRKTFAGGLALGLFIGCTPTMGAQIILAAVAAYFLRLNIPIALAGSLITNPFTAAIIYPLEYQLGVWLVGVPEPRELEGYSGMLRNFARYAKPLWIGSLVAGGALAALAYGLASLFWVETAHLTERHRRKKQIAPPGTIAIEGDRELPPPPRTGPAEIPGPPRSDM